MCGVLNYPADYDPDTALRVPYTVHRRRVLELGAGMGVAGLIAHKTGAAAVVMTDGDSSVIKHLNEVRRA